jgi:hypothetical protein
MLGLVAAATVGFIIGVFQMPESALDATFRLTQTVVIIPFMVIVGLRANGWRRKGLAKKGYTTEPERRVEGVTSIRVGKEKDLRIIPGNRGKVRRNGCVRPLRNK